jgi:hypothetical protein
MQAMWGFRHESGNALEAIESASIKKSGGTQLNRQYRPKVG